MKHINCQLSILLVLFASVQVPVFSQQIKIREGILLNLYDAFGKNDLLTKDFGFSCITKYKGKTILFDAGSNADIFKSNTKQLGVDLKKVDIVIVSHGHFDHLNGLDYLLKINPKVKIYFPYDIFWAHRCLLMPQVKSLRLRIHCLNI
jgi:7,8-dihydropterin-6-yl-methyl-4-(beta-D-ribofuranosyl)aminobenzene 5'-phosphate synthase